MEDVKEIRKNLNDSQMALFDVSVKLEELGMALDELLNAYDTDFELNPVDMEKFFNGDFENKIGEKSFEFLCEHKRIMWLVRTAKMYCKQAQKICDGANV